MNYTLIKIAPSDEEEYVPQTCKPSHFVKTDAFTVLPPLSPQIPGPPPTPSPYRILPPIVSRKRPSFVILQEVGSRPPSRDPSPSGRVSPFRGCGFKPPSREPSPAARGGTDDDTKDDSAHQSRSRLPVALKTPSPRKVSKSVSPSRTKSSGIPVPLSRRTSCSPNRMADALRVVDKNAPPRKSPLKSSENLLCRRPVSESDLKSALRKPTTADIGRPRKPPLPRKPTVSTDVARASKPCCSPESKKRPAAGIGSSPGKRSPLSKLNACEKGAQDAGRTATKPRPGPKSPSRISSTKSKENLSPCSRIPSPVKVQKNNAAKTTKSARTTPKGGCTPQVRSRPEEKPKKAEGDPKPETKEKDKGDAVVGENQKGAKNVKCEKPPPCKRNVCKKSLTTSNLLNALKKTAEEGKCQGCEKTEKKDLPHTDTSRSLPINIATSNMTDSSVTLIRTTTEPALAPVQPDLIPELRSAINEVKNVGEPTCVKQEAKLVGSVDTTPLVPSTPTEEAKMNGGDKRLEAVEDAPKPESQGKQTKPNSPRPAHIMAVAKIGEPKQELTSPVVEIKQEADGEVLSANSSSVQSESRNGISKSSWLSER